MIGSIILDIGMLSLCFISLDWAFNIDYNATCNSTFTVSFIYTITFITLIRCSHIFVICIILCCIPCYMCRDSCCLKKRLVRGKLASKEVKDALEVEWTWL